MRKEAAKNNENTLEIKVDKQNNKKKSKLQKQADKRKKVRTEVNAKNQVEVAKDNRIKDLEAIKDTKKSIKAAKLDRNKKLDEFDEKAGLAKQQKNARKIIIINSIIEIESLKEKLRTQKDFVNKKGGK